MTEKIYISPANLLEDSVRLGLDVFRSGFRPDFIVGVWRGGTPVGIAVQEVLKVCGIPTDHISIRTSSYSGIGQRDKDVRVHGLDYIIGNINAEDNLLLVDDVFDSGLSIQAVIDRLGKKCRRNTPENIRIATPWFKPANNKTLLRPDYFLHETSQWLVFPHELEGLTREEVLRNKPEFEALFDLL